ncbi:hypothetical protein KAV79_06120 [Candidatus Aerophobetes bacterium]|nr:hypothetical protein [Candidatus Aerophobetes bacterium]
MELWIRNQDRKGLKLVKNLTVKGKKVVGYTLSMRIGAPDQSTLGEYETKERTMAVLDSIEKKIESSPNRIAVFDMPKE